MLEKLSTFVDSMFSNTAGKFELPVASVEEVTRQQAEFEQASKHGQNTRDATIRLIWTQVHSRSRDHVRLGLKGAKTLLTLKAEEEQQLRYLAAVAEYNLGEYKNARDRLAALLQDYPSASQAKHLKQAIEDKMTTDTVIAGGAITAIVGVTAAVAGAALLMGNSKQSSK